MASGPATALGRQVFDFIDHCCRPVLANDERVLPTAGKRFFASTLATAMVNLCEIAVCALWQQYCDARQMDSGFIDRYA